MISKKQQKKTTKYKKIEKEKNRKKNKKNNIHKRRRFLPKRCLRRRLFLLLHPCLLGIRFTQSKIAATAHCSRPGCLLRSVAVYLSTLYLATNSSSTPIQRHFFCGGYRHERVCHGRHFPRCFTTDSLWVVTRTRWVSRLQRQQRQQRQQHRILPTKSLLTNGPRFRRLSVSVCTCQPV